MPFENTNILPVSRMLVKRALWCCPKSHLQLKTDFTVTSMSTKRNDSSGLDFDSNKWNTQASNAWQKPLSGCNSLLALQLDRIVDWTRNQYAFTPAGTMKSVSRSWSAACSYDWSTLSYRTMEDNVKLASHPVNRTRIKVYSDVRMKLELQVSCQSLTLGMRNLVSILH